MDVEAKYYLGSVTLDKNKTLALEWSEYALLINARRILSDALNIEEKYDVALCNYMEFEKEQLTITLDNLVNSIHYDYNRTYEVLSTLNRRLVNFLSTGRKYTELVASLAAKCSSNSSETEASIGALLSKHYDECLDYRAMEILRNHVNHSGLAVHTVSAPSNWTVDDNKKANHLVFNLEIYAEKKILAENPKFKKAVLKELPEKFDLKKGARSYIGAISHVHEQVRKTISENVEGARNTIEEYLKKHSDLNDGESFPIGAFIERPNTPVDTPIMIILDWDNVRVGLSKKNLSISNMTRRHISSALVTK
jgi:hypothetical protein